MNPLHLGALTTLLSVSLAACTTIPTTKGPEADLSKVLIHLKSELVAGTVPKSEAKTDLRIGKVTVVLKITDVDTANGALKVGIEPIEISGGKSTVGTVENTVTVELTPESENHPNWGWFSAPGKTLLLNNPSEVKKVK